MAYAMTKQGSLDNCVTYEFICDTITDMNAIENRYRTIGSVAVVLQGESDGLEVYIAGSDKQWNNLGSMGASNSQGGSSGLSIYICAQNEVSNGLPDISEPDESTIYLVPANETSGNLYDEYIYVDDNWELFGGANIDLSNYVLKNNPTMTGTLSLNRKSNTTVGELSVAIGNNVEASGNYSFAEGDSTIASAQAAHAEGGGTTASGLFAHAEGSGTSAQGAYTHAEGGGSRAIASGAHAEGGGTTANGNNSHAEGGGTTVSGSNAHAEGASTLASGSPSHAEGTSTVASGNNSHAEGLATTASGNSSHVEGNNTTAIGFAEHVSGQFNVIDSAPAWVANTSYVVNDIVSKETTFTDGGGVQRTRVVIYKCKIANSDDTFTSSNWTEWGQYLVVVGNGAASIVRSNAYALDWNGNEYLKGDLYVNCSADSTNGTKVTPLPTPPVNDGNYILKVNVASGTATYSWVALSDLSGVTF